MIIGKYTIGDWEYRSVYWRREVYDVNGHHAGLLFIGESEEHGIPIYYLYVNVFSLREIFFQMYNIGKCSDMKFKSCDDAKHMADVFINKVNKLKAFL